MKESERRPGGDDTARAKAIKSSARLLRDLKKFERAPVNAAVREVEIPTRISPSEFTSGCGSPGRMCAELAD